MWWLILPGVLLIVMIYLLFAPVLIDVDSNSGLIGLRYGSIVSCVLLLNEEEQVIRLRVGWWKKEIDLAAKGPDQTQRERVQEKWPRTKRKRRKMEPRKMFRKVRGVLGSFRLLHCEISIDTGDMPLNGMLYPWVYLLSLRTGKNVSINFSGEDTVILQAQNTVARMLWAFIKS